MSSSWFPFFSSDSVSKETIVPNSRDEDEVFPVAKELTSQERRSQSMSAIKCKLREERKSKSIAPGMNFSFDSIFRPISNIINDGSNSETGNEGIGVAHAHHVMNSNISCKYNLINPQQSGLDVTLEMHGFADSVAATYNTAGRYQLMYQRVTKLGGVLVGQWAVMPGMGMMPGMASAGGGAPAGNFFGMMEYPWRRHSNTVFSYLKGKQATVAHTERLIRGLHVGVSMKYEMDTHLTSNTYGAQFVTSDRKTTWAVEMNDHGSMKIGCVRKDWASDAQMAVELDVTDKRGAKISTLNLGLQKPLLGGGMMRICLLNFAKVRGVLELPFGGDRLGFNQMKIAYSMLYEAKSSSLKHGLMFTV